MANGKKLMLEYMYCKFPKIPPPPFSYSKQEPRDDVPWRPSNLTLTYMGEDKVQYELFNSWQFVYP